MFQNQVYITPAQAVPGDFASSNPFHTTLSSNGKMVADAAGVTVGKFGVLNANGTVTSVPGAAPSSPTRIGFVHREFGVAQITTFMAEAGSTIQPGQYVPLFSRGDFFTNADVVNGTPARGTPILWDTTTGNTVIGGTATATLVATMWYLVSETATVGSIVQISTAA